MWKTTVKHNQFYVYMENPEGERTFESESAPSVREMGRHLMIRFCDEDARIIPLTLVLPREGLACVEVSKLLDPDETPFVRETTGEKAEKDAAEGAAFGLADLADPPF
jgi:hypothetical protein